MVDNQTQHQPDTIAAIATPPGRGGVGVIRVSGPDAWRIAKKLTALDAQDRRVNVTTFTDPQNQVIDHGLLLGFKGPNSFTGEDVVELHGHGGPVIQDLILQAVIEFGARQARAGEFTERAFLNDKIDLTQAEAIADLIDSSTAAAARGAVNSLQGEFSKRIKYLLSELIALRVFVEAAIDFPDEEVDFLADEGVTDRVLSLETALTETLAAAGQGAILREGLTVVLAGAPNAGKSSLLNRLAGEQRAIVTDVPGTTRDIIKQTISIDGLPLNIIDTAGLRETEDQVEKIGVDLARDAMAKADHILFMLDATELPANPPQKRDNTTLLINKADLVQTQSLPDWSTSELQISALTGFGLDQLKHALKQIAGFNGAEETTFTARRRHITALEEALRSVKQGRAKLDQNGSGELLAEELKQAQNKLNEITGEFSADDLLGEIFAGFCIGK